MFAPRVEINEANIEKVTIAYKQAYAQIVAEIETATDFGTRHRKLILAQIREILIDLGANVNDLIEIDIENAYKEGAIEAVNQLKKVNGQVTISTGFNRIHQDAITALVDETATAFGESIQGVNRSAQYLLTRAVKEQITQRMATGMISGKALRETKNMITGLLRAEGLDSLVDKSGRGWTLDRYAEMLIRTKTVEARNRGLVNRIVENDYDLVQVSAHGATDVCGRWEGRILSSSGQTPGYSTVAQATEDGLFHPNCRHAINVLVPELAKVTKAYNPNIDTLTGKEFIDEVDIKFKGLTKPLPLDK